TVSHDEKYLVYEKESGDNVLGPAYTAHPGIYILEISTGKETYLEVTGKRPTFSTDDQRIFIQKGNSLISVNLKGEEERKVFDSKYGSQYCFSPDGQWVAFVYLHQVYIAAIPAVGKVVELEANSKAYPIKMVSKDAGFNLHWSSDSRHLHYTNGPQYFSIPLTARFNLSTSKADSTF